MGEAAKDGQGMGACVRGMVLYAGLWDWDWVTHCVRSYCTDMTWMLLGSFDWKRNVAKMIAHCERIVWRRGSMSDHRSLGHSLAGSLGWMT